MFAKPPTIPGDIDLTAYRVTRPNVVRDTVIQTTSATSAVTINAAAGKIITFPSTLDPGNTTEFVVSNSFVGTDSIILVSIQGYVGSGFPSVIVVNITDNQTFTLSIKNTGAEGMNNYVTISFLIV